MKILSVILIVVLVAQSSRATPFLGNNFVVPQVQDLSRSANSIVSYLNTAQSSVSSYVRYPPTSVQYLQDGATVLTQYIGNVTRLVGSVYSQLNIAINDKSTQSELLFLRLNASLIQTKPFLDNSSLYIAAMREYFGYVPQTSSSPVDFLANFNHELNETITNLESIVEDMSKIVKASSGQTLNTQQFISFFIDTQVLPSLELSLKNFQMLSSEYSKYIANFVRAINNANTFRATFSSRFVSARNSVNQTMNAYLTTSNGIFNQYPIVLNGLLSHLKTQHNDFMFKWPLIPNNSSQELIDEMLEATETLLGNANRRREQRVWQADQIRSEYVDQSIVFQRVEDEGDAITRITLNVDTNYCVADHSQRFNDRIYIIRDILSRALTTQSTLEREALSIFNTNANVFLKSYITNAYNSLNQCLSFPFQFMNECLDQTAVISMTTQKLLDLDTLLQFYDDLFMDLQPQAYRVFNYVDKNHLDYACFGKSDDAKELS